MDGHYTKVSPSNAQNATLVPTTSSPTGGRDGIKANHHPSMPAPRALGLITDLTTPPSQNVMSPSRMELDEHETGVFTAESNLKAIGLDMEIDIA